MSKLVLLTWLWQQKDGRTRFKALHVNIFAAMVRRHCTLPIELACVTDMPDGIDPSIRIIEPPGFYDGFQTSRWKGGRPSCYRRLAIYRRDAARLFGAKRIASMDLDVVIGGNIDSILGRAEDFVICAPSQKGSRWLYNGSLQMLTAGARPQVYERFTPEEAEIASQRFVGSDQAWIAHVLGPGEATWTERDGVTRFPNEQHGAMQFFPGQVKPWDAIGKPWVAKNYRMDGGRRGLVLGRKSTVWEEAKAALDEGDYDGVIAFTKTADKWPGRIDAVAESQLHAEYLARMLGFDTTRLCGV